ncbi:DUF3592 domain-containing protein [Pyxidicoccus fallax]|uniref:DUF3592 domain-containing protein n=1 Tax=Pyxidicoccus fallax TaxID=394095 RepID=A0A848LUK4_9BACT|nr:DUF3592 domain-containing protein [Pyxidicoccus fallax]NMO21456.1 DUF3592 domain-containing protein [Pyxidicoccus fallax]NPC82665.1 DUF3592 domain-containing protein [Pyxidicoccus fallax]
MLRKFGTLALVFFWALFTLGADVLILQDPARDLLALGWPSVTGTITHSSVRELRGKGTTYHLDVRYTYDVGGQHFQGVRYRHFNRGLPDRGEVEERARRYAVGTEVPVFHSPGDPSRAVLEPGVTGGDLFMLMVLLPFNLVLVGITLSPLRRKAPGGTVSPEQRAGRLYVTLDDTSPVVAGAYGAGYTTLACIVLVGIPTRFHPSLPLVALAWAAILLVSLFAAGWKRSRLASGHYELVVDPRARRLSLPAILDRKERRDVAWDDIRDITVETHTQTSSRGGTQTSYRPTLVLAAGDPERRQEALVDWADADRAAALADWLRARLKPRGRDADASLSA